MGSDNFPASPETSRIPGTSGAELASRIAVVIALCPSKAKAAEIASVSHDQLGRYAKGRAIPPFDVLIRLSAYTKVDLNWLATGKGAMLIGATSSESGPQPPRISSSPAITTDHRLIGRLTEKIMLVYKEMGIGIALHQAAERAAQEHDRIVTEVADPDDRLIQIGMVMSTLRQELEAKAAAPSSSKQRA